MPYYKFSEVIVLHCVVTILIFSVHGVMHACPGNTDEPFPYKPMCQHYFFRRIIISRFVIVIASGRYTNVLQLKE